MTKEELKAAILKWIEENKEDICYQVFAGTKMIENLRNIVKDA